MAAEHQVELSLPSRTTDELLRERLAAVEAKLCASANAGERADREHDAVRLRRMLAEERRS